MHFGALRPLIDDEITEIGREFQLVVDRIIFKDDEGTKMVETTVWQATERHNKKMAEKRSSMKNKREHGKTDL